MRKLTAALAAAFVVLPLAAPAQHAPRYTRPPWVRCPASDPTVYVSSRNVFHFPSADDGSLGHYACRSQAEKEGAKPGKDIVEHDKQAAAAAASPTASPDASPNPTPSRSPGP